MGFTATLGSSMIRSLAEVAYEFEQPFRLDVGRYKSPFGRPGHGSGTRPPRLSLGTRTEPPCDSRSSPANPQQRSNALRAVIEPPRRR